MALNFPPVNSADGNPTNGMIWSSPEGLQWIYDSSVPGWKALAPTGNSNIIYRGGIKLDEDPNTQYNDIQAGNEFSVVGDYQPVSAGFYPGIEGRDVLDGQIVRWDGNEWHEIGQAYPYATEAENGVIKLATESQAKAATNHNRAMTPLRVKQSIDKQVPQATIKIAGRTEYATQKQAQEATATDCALTPSSIYQLVQQIVENQVNSVPTGMVMWWTAEKNSDIPAGWLPCDGRRIYNSGSTAKLFKFLKSVGNTWSSNPNIVKVPDLRGRFIRGFHEGKEDRDPELEDFGRSQDDKFKKHDHSIDDPGHRHDVEGRRLKDNANLDPRVIVDDDRSGSEKYEDENAAQKSFTKIKVLEEGDCDETRPKNINLRPVIKL